MRLVMSLGMLALALPAQAASFDCQKAATPDERVICADPHLSELDTLVARAFAQATKAGEKARALKTAHNFLAHRKACGSDKTCIRGRQVEALLRYRDLGAIVAVPSWASGTAPDSSELPERPTLPIKVGECGATRIARIVPRLGSDEPPVSTDFDSGTTVEFENGGHQVSYQREEAILNSKPGDKVLMCLIAVPHECPPGDDRGRVYTSTNLRTQQSWSLPDSQHSCGGA
jgi:uncharacterized protein